MQQPKRKQVFVKASAIATLLAMAFPLLFTGVILLKQQLVKHQMLERLEGELVKTFTFSNNHIQWVESGRELLVNGKMFDVKSFETGADSTTVSGIFDWEEDALIKKTSILTGHNSKSSGYVFSLVLQTLLPSICNGAPVFHLVRPCVLTKVRLPLTSNENTVLMSYPVYLPPPKSLG